MEAEKKCPRCCLTKPLSAFSVNRRAKDGRQGYCFLCAASYFKERYRDDPKFRETSKTYARQWKADYFVPTDDSRAWDRAYAKRWRAAHPEECKAKKRRRKALKHGCEAKPYLSSEIFERDGWTCYMCQQPVDREAKAPHPRSPTIDHIIPLSKGGPDAPSNVACACWECNIRKGNRMDPELLVLLR